MMREVCIVYLCLPECRGVYVFGVVPVVTYAFVSVVNVSCACTCSVVRLEYWYVCFWICAKCGYATECRCMGNPVIVMGV